MEMTVYPQATTPLLVDLKGMSKLVSLSVSTLRKYTGRGMPHYKLERKILVDPQEVVDWIKQSAEVCGQGQDDVALSAYLDDVLSRLE